MASPGPTRHSRLAGARRFLAPYYSASALLIASYFLTRQWWLQHADLRYAHMVPAALLQKVRSGEGGLYFPVPRTPEGNCQIMFIQKLLWLCSRASWMLGRWLKVWTAGSSDACPAAFSPRYPTPAVPALVHAAPPPCL